MGLFGGGGGGGGGFLGLGSTLGGLPLVGGLFGGGSQGNQMPGMPIPPMASPGYGPGAWGGWPVPQSNPSAAPQQNFTGNLGQPGPAENYFGQNAGRFTQPGQLPSWWSQNQGQFGGSGPADQYWQGLSGKWNAPGVSQNAQTAWNQFNQSVPADTSPYYNNAIRNATGDINQAMASRGLYGGGTGAAPVAAMITNMRGQQALNDAQYGLQRAGLGGQLASGADQSSLAALQGQLGWLTGLGGLGIGVQNADLNRLLGGAGIAGNIDAQTLAGLNSGMNAALGAQNALAQRGQNFFGNNLMMGNALSQSLQNIYMQQMAAELGLTQQQIQAALGYGTNAANQSVNNQQRSEQGIMNLGSMFGFGGGGGGGGGLLGGIL